MTLVLLAMLAAAPDAPVCSVEPGRSMLVEGGTIVPFRATCIDEQEHVRRECINERNVGELEAARGYVWLTRGALAALIGGAAAGLVTTIASILLVVLR